MSGSYLSSLVPTKHTEFIHLDLRLAGARASGVILGSNCRLGSLAKRKLDGVADEHLQRLQIPAAVDLGRLEVQPTELAAFRRRRAAGWFPADNTHDGI